MIYVFSFRRFLRLQLIINTFTDPFMKNMEIITICKMITQPRENKNKHITSIAMNAAK